MNQIADLDPQTSLLIDRLIKEITDEFNITTIVITHDMNSVMEMGDYILYTCIKGKKNGKDIIKRLFSMRMKL